MTLEKEFDSHMIRLPNIIEQETGYNPTILRRMVAEHGGLETAKNLINRPNPSDGYARLWQLERLDLTVEARVLENSQFHPLFEQEELKRCKRRLIEYQYEKVKDITL